MTYENITKLGENSYQIRFAYLDPVTREAKRLKRRVTGTLEEAIRERERLLALARSGHIKEDKGHKALVSEYYDAYVESLENRRRPATRATMQSLRLTYKNKIAPTAGMWPVADITRGQVEILLETWSRSLKPNGEYYAPQSVRVWVNVLQGLLLFAFKRTGREDAHILRDLSLPDQDTQDQKGRALTPDEARLLLDYLYQNNPFWYTFTQVSLLTGQRFGSVSALRWGDVDRDKIRFAQSQFRGTVKKGNKTNKVIELPMLPHLWDVLEAHRDYLEVTGHPNKDLGLIFPGVVVGAQNGYLCVSAFRNVLKRACKKIAIPHVNAHDLRRTANTWMVNAGVPELTIRGIVGHSRAEMTARYYRGDAAHTAQALTSLEGIVTSSMK